MQKVGNTTGYGRRRCTGKMSLFCFPAEGWGLGMKQDFIYQPWISVAPLRNVWRLRFYLGMGISGSGDLAGPALPLSSQNSSAFQKSRGWNSPQGIYLALAWVTRNVYGSNSTSWRERQPGSARLQLSPMNHRRSHGLQRNPRDEPGKETPPECPSLATCFPLDSAQGSGFTPGLFVSPEQFLGGGLIS